MTLALGLKKTNIVKKVALVSALVLFSLALGWVGACIRVQRQASERMAQMEEHQAKLMSSIRQRIYGSNYFHQKGISPDGDRHLEQFDPARSRGKVTMSYVGGLGSADIHLQIQADGNIFITDHGVSRKVITVDQGRCKDFFIRVMTSGILNYSDDVIALKVDLIQPNTRNEVLDAPMTEFQISVPELEIEKDFSICRPESQVKANPDIIEFQLAAALEKEILSFVPKADPFWK